MQSNYIKTVAMLPCQTVFLNNEMPFLFQIKLLGLFNYGYVNNELTKIMEIK